MNLADYLLNVAAVLLWLSWRSARFIKPAPVATISSVLKHVGTSRPRRWLLLVWLLVLLLGRGVLYWRIGSRVNWVPLLNIGCLSLQFNSVSPTRMLIFSFASFGVMLFVFYVWLLLLDVVNRRVPDTDIWQKMVRLHLGWLHNLPALLKLTLPAFVLAATWVFANPYLVEAGMAVRPTSAAHMIQQAAVVGLGAFLAWKYLIVVILFLGIVNTYLYLGSHSFWSFVSVTSRNILGPLRRAPLRTGRVDFSGAAALALVWLVWTAAERYLSVLFRRLPL